jgi:molecular chaperone HscA
MDHFEAKILLKNLLRRIKPIDSEQYDLSGALTVGEYEALHYAFELLNTGPKADVSSSSGISSLTSTSDVLSALATPETATDTKAISQPDLEVMEPIAPSILLDLSIFDLPEAAADSRLCLDFGTAMSKATLVINDEEDEEYEEVHVLELGIPGDQQDVSNTMLISSVYIDNDGLLWFGKNAVDRSLIEGADGQRMRIDNVKRYLTEGALHSVFTPPFNPTMIPMKGIDLLLAYLTFMTWTVNVCVEEIDLPRNIKRRFAMPCFNSEMDREVANNLRTLLGEAQVLSDTFGARLHNGLSLTDFVEAVRLLRATSRTYNFITENLTEPLGVANALLSSSGNTNAITLIIDVGAGTSDMSLYRMHLNPDKQIRQALEIEGAARGIQRAGNHLDKALIELILKKANITSQHPRALNIRCALELSIREYKEALFNDEFLMVNLLDGQTVEVTLDEFKNLSAVKAFSEDLETCLTEVLGKVDESWMGVAANAGLAVVLTGGGAKLPMVLALSEGPLDVKGRTIKRIRAAHFPGWLEAEHPELEDEFPRIAVSLGGARKRLIKGGKAKVTAGDVRGTPVLGGSYSR